MEYINVLEVKKVPRDCSTCLYKGSNNIICANANNHGRMMWMVNGGQACDYYWLNQNKYTRQ